MREDQIGAWLDGLASAAPTPGGGAAAALAAATAAALVEMVVNLTAGRAAYAEHEAHIRQVGAEAHALRERAVELAGADAAAFDAVMAAYRQPRETPGRAVAIQRATAAATRPPLAVAGVAARVAELAATLPGRSNRNVLSDVGVAASLAASALESAAVNVEVNLGALTDQEVRDALRAELAGHLDRLPVARQALDVVRESLA